MCEFFQKQLKMSTHFSILHTIGSLGLWVSWYSMRGIVTRTIYEHK